MFPPLSTTTVFPSSQSILPERRAASGVAPEGSTTGRASRGKRSRPVPIEDSNFIMETDMVVIAVGAGANPLLTSTMPDLELNKWGYVLADADGRTSVPGVWAGGDIVTGAATVILAAGAGKAAAASIHDWLTAEPGEDGKKKWPYEENEKVNEW